MVLTYHPDTNVGPVDLWMHSLFSDVSVSLNDEKLVSPPTSMYPYRAYIETLLRYGPAAKESRDVAQGHSGTTGQENDDNKGFTSRNKMTALCRSVQMMGNYIWICFVKTNTYSTTWIWKLN